MQNEICISRYPVDIELAVLTEMQDVTEEQAIYRAIALAKEVVEHKRNGGKILLVTQPKGRFSWLKRPKRERLEFLGF